MQILKQPLVTGAICSISFYMLQTEASSYEQWTWAGFFILKPHRLFLLKVLADKVTNYHFRRAYLIAINIFLRQLRRKQDSHHIFPFLCSFYFPAFGIQQGCVSNENLNIIIPKTKDCLETSNSRCLLGRGNRRV